ncbi:S41 family peptidase [Cytobacillus kochii]|uniref:S41 family peptidase n=1 Tax=Cytobacillus kochii TaxID=859143 RepID=UPI003907F4F4
MGNKKVVILMVISLLVGAIGSYAGFQLKLNISQTKQLEEMGGSQQLASDLEKMNAAYQLIYKNYVEEVDAHKLTEGAIQGMLSTLNDDYSVYMDESTAKQFSETLDSSFEGIGAEVSLVDGKIIIVSPVKNSPAEQAGLKPNDQIIKIDDESVEGFNLLQATLKIKGKKGTKVKLTIMREGLQNPLEIEIVRAEIPHITVNSEVIMHDKEKVGYVEITSFATDTAKEFKIALKDLEEQGMDSLLIDVRNNPGGLLKVVDEILEELVTKDKPYVQIEQRNGERMMNFSPLEEKKSYPIGVLIDKGSASASEILAAALKEAGDYPLIGTQTFGKGTVQQPVPMGDGSNIKLTLYKWLTPDGNWIHKKGVAPTYEVKQSELYETHPIQVEKTLKTDMNNDQVRNAQFILKSLGYAPGREDGYYSAATATAVRAFQHAAGLTANGQIDEKTAESLEKEVIKQRNNQDNDMQLQTGLRIMANQ